MTKTIKDLLREDNAQPGDVYEACGRQWALCDGDFIGRAGTYGFVGKQFEYMPADGWTRVSPRKPLQVEFETEVSATKYEFAELRIPVCGLEVFAGKRVRVTVTKLREDDECQRAEEANK